jgi:outer membrane protein TolC
VNSHGFSARQLILGTCALASIFLPFQISGQQPVAPVMSDSSTRAKAVPAMDSVLHRALVASSAQLAARHLALRAAEARARSAGSRPAGALSGVADEIPRGLDITAAGSLQVGFEQELLGGSWRSAQRSAATSDIEIARAAVVATERRLFAALDRNLVKLGGWSAIARRLTAEDDLLSSAEASLRGRFAAGDARYVDVLRLRTERLRVQGERAAATTEAAASRSAILGLIEAPGDSPDLAGALDAVTRDEPSFILGLVPGVDSLLAASGALLLSRARIAQANAKRRLTLAEQRPRMTASLAAQRFQKESGGHFLGPALGFSTTLPFTAGRANRARAEAADLDLQAEEAQQRSYLASLRRTISVALDRYEAARVRLSVYDAALLRGAREEREGALASFRSGELSLIELLDFERALSRAEIDRIKTRVEAAEALGAIYGAADEGSPDSAGDRRWKGPLT